MNSNLAHCIYRSVSWLDMGHAGGDDISLLKQQFDAGESPVINITQ